MVPCFLPLYKPFRNFVRTHWDLCTNARHGSWALALNSGCYAKTALTIFILGYSLHSLKGSPYALNPYCPFSPPEHVRSRRLSIFAVVVFGFCAKSPWLIRVCGCLCLLHHSPDKAKCPSFKRWSQLSIISARGRDVSREWRALWPRVILMTSHRYLSVNIIPFQELHAGLFG